jgi:hypothetical protein
MLRLVFESFFTNKLLRLGGLKCRTTWLQNLKLLYPLISNYLSLSTYLNIKEKRSA